MVLELQKQQYIAQTGSVQAGQLEASNTTTPQKAIVEGGELGAPVDSLTATGAGVDVELKTKRTSTELYNSISSELNKNGVNFNRAEVFELLSAISGKTEEELLSAEESEIKILRENINSAINAIKNDIKDIKDGKESLTLDLVKNYAKLLNGTLQPAGWDSIDSFRKAQTKIGIDGKSAAVSLSERLKKMYGCDISKLTKEQLAEKLEAYFDGYFNELVKSGKSKEEVDRLQLSDFSKLLFNSTQEEYDMFRDAIEYLVVNNRHKGYKAILESFDNDAQRTTFANETTYEQVEKWNTKADQRGEVASVETAKLNTAAVLEYKDETHLVEYHESAKKDALDFYTEETKGKLAEITEADIKKIQDKLVKIEEIQAIQRKLEQGEKITAEEQALLENPVELTAEEQETLRIYAEDKHHKGDNAGQIIGITNNKVVATEAKEELITTVNADAYEIGEKAGNDFYREVLTQVAKYAEELPEEAKAEFKAFITKTIGENYTKIVNDIANGTKTELSAPAVQAKAETPQAEVKKATAEVVNKNTVDNRYNAGIEVDLIKPQTMTTELYANNPAIKPVQEVEQAPQNEAEAAKGGLKAVKEFIKTTGENILTTIVEFLNLHNIGETILGWAYELIGRKNDQQIANICNYIENNDRKIVVLDMINTIGALKNVNSNNNLVIGNIDERKKELQEREMHSCNKQPLMA